ncbi:uncharacterized protein [Ptychodera flava]|uniref:uncharacterized protein n=1 Tax=Ptychodera flava TaxID=63121 RepID=UPI00396A53DE
MELETLLAEVEASINDRPLTYVSSHVDDLTPLTPSQLVNGRNISGLPYAPPSDPTEYTPNVRNLNRRCEHLSSLLRTFWKRWSTEYLTALRERHLHTTDGTKHNTVKVGDVVLIHSDVDKRVNWHLARVTRLLPGEDGIVRTVEIKTKMGKTNRPVTKLYPLETSGIPSTADLTSRPVRNPLIEDNAIQSQNTDEAIQTERARPTRKAAEVAMQKIKHWTC